MSNPYRDKLMSVGVMKSGLSRERVLEYRDTKDGHKIKETIDENRNSKIEHANDDTRQDVMLRPQTVEIDMNMMGK